MKAPQTSKNANPITPAIRGFAFFNALKISGAANFNALKIRPGSERLKEGMALQPIK